MKFNDIFAVCLLEHDIDSELADELEYRITPLLNQLPQQGSYGDLHHTDYQNTIIEIDKIAPELIEIWIESIKSYSEKTSIQVGEYLHYWTQDYHENETHDIHGHGIGGISGIYWLRANELAGSVKFYNPNPIAEHVYNNDANNPYVNSSLNIKCKKGKLIVFPSYLKHKVVTKGPKAVRTAIPFNVSKFPHVE